MNELECQLISAMERLDEAALLASVSRLLDHGCDYFHMQYLLNAGMKRVGDIFEAGEYFIADLMFSGVLYNEVLDIICNEMDVRNADLQGTILIAVMENDIHDIGKNILSSVLRASGFQIIDLGMDVSAEKIVDAVEKRKPDILMLSGVMDFSVNSMKETIRLLAERGLRDQVCVVVGGNCVNSHTQKQVGADACFKDVLDTLEYSKKIVGDKYQ